MNQYPCDGFNFDEIGANHGLSPSPNTATQENCMVRKYCLQTKVDEDSC